MKIIRKENKMNSIWSITLDDYINVVEICQKMGMKAGDDMQSVFFLST